MCTLIRTVTALRGSACISMNIFLTVLVVRIDPPIDEHRTITAHIRVLISMNSKEPIDVHADPHSGSSVWISMQMNRLLIYALDCIDISKYLTKKSKNPGRLVCCLLSKVFL